MSLKIITAALAATLAVAVPAFAQEAMDHTKMGHAMPADSGGMGQPKGDNGPSSTAFAQANAAMHKAMDFAYSGNADVDFVRGMIAHHQGAIAMAKVELQFGKDAALRKLATEVIAAQEAEVTMMQDWLAKNGG